MDMLFLVIVGHFVLACVFPSVWLLGVYHAQQLGVYLGRC